MAQFLVLADLKPLPCTFDLLSQEFSVQLRLQLVLCKERMILKSLNIYHFLRRVRYTFKDGAHFKQTGEADQEHDR